jgi:hypothetical protein
MSFATTKPFALIAVLLVALGASAELLRHANAAVALPASSAQVTSGPDRAVTRAPDYLPSHFALQAEHAEPLPAQF